jgi:ArsR family transcriptional regulator, arsenate/arsenite/antimonite-responsive transcriptional repressor / arsenate reductase (thioredoxin)
VEPPAVLQLLAEPKRWQVLTALAASDRRVGELCELLDLPQNLVSYHLRALKDGGLVSSRRSSFDGRDTWYRIDLGRLATMLGDAGAALDPSLQLAPVPPGPVWGKPKVLFLCTGNSARSQIAEALLEHRSVGRVSARSAGSDPKPLHPHAVRVMAERGIDISSNTTKHVRRFARVHFDRVITLCDKVREVCPELPGEPVTAHWSTADPAAEGDLAAFERTVEQLEGRIDALIAQLSNERGGTAHAHAG